MPLQTSIDRTTLAETLHYGAPINLPSAPELPFSVDTLEAARRHREGPARRKRELLDEGARIWRDVCRRTAEQANHPLLLPLSAGLDSRAVLAGLREVGASVQTVTYGIPGAFDYEIAPQIARAVGAPHDRIDLQQLEITRAKLLDIARRAPRPSILLDMFFNAAVASRYGDKRTYVNGFIGDVLAGKNLGKASGLHWEEACKAFAQWCRVSRTAVLTDQDMDPRRALPSAPFVDPDLLPSIQQLDYAIRQQQFVRPIVCPAGVEVITPFLDPEWHLFMLGLPGELRADRAFFIELFTRSYPQLFALPTTATGGLPLGASPDAIKRHRRRLRRRRRMRARLHRFVPAIRVPPANRGWQYLDFRTLLRQDSSLAELFSESMRRLDAHQVVPWIDAQGLLRAHRALEDDHFKALNVLFNLELLLEAQPKLFQRL